MPEKRIHVECEKEFWFPGERWKHELLAGGTYRCTGKPARKVESKDSLLQPQRDVGVAGPKDVAPHQPKKKREARSGRINRQDRTKYNERMREFMRGYRKRKKAKPVVAQNTGSGSGLPPLP